MKKKVCKSGVQIWNEHERILVISPLIASSNLPTLEHHFQISATFINKSEWHNDLNNFADDSNVM